MALLVLILTVGIGLAVLGIAQTLEHASLIDSQFVQATFFVQMDSLEGLFVGSTIFLFGTMLFASAIANHSSR